MEACEPSTPAEKDMNKFYYQEHVVGSVFPPKSQTLLHFMVTNGMEHIVGWLPHADRSFSIFNPKEFEKIGMGRFFNRSKLLASFTRQLNLYNFKRITVGHDAGLYYHENFLRGKPFLAIKIIHTCMVKGTKVRVGFMPGFHIEDAGGIEIEKQKISFKSSNPDMNTDEI